MYLRVAVCLVHVKKYHKCKFVPGLLSMIVACSLFSFDNVINQCKESLILIELLL